VGYAWGDCDTMGEEGQSRWGIRKGVCVVFGKGGEAM